MAPWLFLLLAFVFACLAVDAWRLAVPWREIPFLIIAKGVGQDVSHQPASEQLQMKQHHRHRGFGDLSGAVWFWAILSAGSAGISCYGFFG